MTDLRKYIKETSDRYIYEDGLMKKEETNDILHNLYPQLNEVEISISQCKQDVTTKDTKNKRGDVWISKLNHNNKNFEKEIVALIEAKHKKCQINDKDWEDAKRQGKEKSLKSGLNFYIVTNTIDTTRFYNSHNDEEISLNSEKITKLQPIDTLVKLNSQISKTNSNLDTKKTHIKISEKDFRNSLRALDNVYRSIKLKPVEKIDTTISFMIIKYISDKEEDEWTFSVKRDKKIILLWLDFTSNYKNDFKNARDNFLSGEYGGSYEDFEKIVSFPPSLTNEHYKQIYEELSDYYLHGADFDLFGVIYEEFADSGEKRKFGEYYTRRHITKTISKLLLRDEKNYRSDLKICDPCCGTGGFLTESFKVLKSNYEREGNLSKENLKHLSKDIFYGFDDREESIARTELNMFLVGDGHTNIKKRDTIKLFNEKKSEGLLEESYDFMISNPPYGIYKGDELMSNFDWTNEKRSELLFVERIVKACKRGGKIAIVVPDGVLETPTRESFRKKLLENVDIDAIISLPKFAFAPYTKEKTYVLFMRRKQKEDEGKIQDKSIWHYIVDFDGYANSDKRYETRLKDTDGNYLHFDLPELEKFFGDRKEFKKIIDDKLVWKSKLVDMKDVGSENFHNLLSEFHLRPIQITEISNNMFEGEYKKIILDIKDIIKKIRLKKSLIPKTRFDMKRIDEVFDFISESNITEEYAYLHQGVYPVYSGQTENDGIFCRIDTYVDDMPCLTFTTYGSAGNLSYREGKFTIGRNCMGLRPKKEFSKKVDLKWFLYTQQPLFFQNTKGDIDGQRSLNKIILGRVKFKLPTNIKYQQKIAKNYESLNLLQERLNMVLYNAKNLKQKVILI